MMNELTAHQLGVAPMGTSDTNASCVLVKYWTPRVSWVNRSINLHRKKFLQSAPRYNTLCDAGMITVGVTNTRDFFAEQRDVLPKRAVHAADFFPEFLVVDSEDRQVAVIADHRHGCGALPSLSVLTHTNVFRNDLKRADSKQWSIRKPTESLD